MEVKLKEFRVYAPPELKSYDLDENGTLTITGIASTTNEDLDGEIVTPNALKSLAAQVVGLNLHLDHNHHYDGGIGVVTDAKLEDSSLRITAVILPEFAKGIKDRLDLGMNFGFSIGGIPLMDRADSRKINDFKLLEMSLTLLPANWDTFGTVETKGIVKSNCLTGACYHILKNKSDIMEKKDVNNQEFVVTDEMKQTFVDIVNEAIYNLKPQLIDDLKGEFLDDIRGELSTIVQDVVAPLLEGSEPEEEKEVDEEILEEEAAEIADDEATEEVAEEPAEAPAEEEEDVEEKEVDEEVLEEEAADIIDDEAAEKAAEEEPAPAEEEVDEVEEKDLEEPPIEEDEAPVEEPAEAAPKVIVDVKELGAEIAKQISEGLLSEVDTKSFKDSLVEDIKSDIYKSLDAKRKTKSTISQSKLKTYSDSKTKSNDDSFLDNDKRDRFGRNKKFL